VQSVGLDPHRGGGAFASRAAPFRRAPLGVGPSKGPRSMLAGGRRGLASLNRGRLAQRDDGPDAAVLARFVHRCYVIAAVEDRDRWVEPARANRVQQVGTRGTSDTLADSTVHATGSSVATSTHACTL